MTITPVDDPPVLAPVGDQVVAEGATSVVTISAADADGDPRTFTATGAAGVCHARRQR